MFKEWLLKDEKAKVGRPKLASEDILKKAKILISVSIIICFVMIFMLVSIIKDVSPIEYAYTLTFGKLGANIKGFGGFSVTQKYDKNNNYVMTLSPNDKVKSYQGQYKYILYKLNGKKWEKYEEQIFKKNTKSIKVNIPANKNKNETYKINLYMLNSAKIKESFAPFSWKFVDSSKQEEKYAYKVFTVKGYYSPVNLEEIKEANKKKDSKVTVSTSKMDPREFTISVPKEKYDINVTYTDESGKKITLHNKKDLTGDFICKVPNVNKVSTVQIRVFSNDIEKLKLTNWKLITDKNKYITNTYLLKPEGNYKY